MPTVQEILKQSGMTDDQIKVLDAKAVQGFDAVLTTATTAQQKAAAAQEEAENAQRAQRELYDREIAPALDDMATREANIRAENAFYRAQNESARAAGFIAADAPGYKPPVAAADPNAARGADGRYVAGQNVVPGSPAYITTADAFKALNHVSRVNQEYFNLFGTFPPDTVEAIAGEAGSQHLDYYSCAARKYGFEAKKAEKAAAAQKAHDDAIRKETAAAKDKEWSEKTSSNPNIRIAEESRFSNLSKGVQAGQIKDPLKMTPEERHRATQTMIQKDIVENQTVQ